MKAAILQLLFYLLIIQSSYAQIPADGLVAYWSFDEGSGITAHDSTGHNNTGTLINGLSWVTGRDGNALSFDGINDYVEINDNNALDLTGGEFTLSAWIYPESYGENLNGRIIDHGGGSVEDGGWSMLVNNYQNSQNLRQYIKSGNVFYNVYSDDRSITLNSWHHTAVTLKSGIITFYVNGLIAGQTAAVPTPTNKNAPVRIGMRATDFLRAYAGVIDEVRIYDRALTPQEAMDLYNQTPTLTDINPPVISDGQPVGLLPLETTTATLSVTTDEAAICKFSTFPDTPYSSISDTFSNTGGTIHTNPISGLEYAASRTYHIKCRDQSGNSNPVDYAVSFSFNRAVYSVSSSGSNSNPGTDALPIKSIQHALNSAGGNNSDQIIIKVAQGTYKENISLTIPLSRILVQGGWSSDFSTRTEAPYLTVIDGNKAGHVINISSDITGDINNIIIEGFTITGAGNTSSGVRCSNCQEVTFRNNRIINNGDSTTSNGISLFAESTVLIEQNTISGNASCGIYLRGESRANIRNNIIDHNLDTGIYRAYGDTTSYIINNVIDSNGAISNGRSGIMTFSNDVIMNNIISNNGTNNPNAGLSVGMYVAKGSDTDPVPNPIIVYNDLHNNYQGEVSHFDPSFISDVTNIADHNHPLFMSNYAREYHLHPDSPLINNGMNTDAVLFGFEDALLYDFEGDTRYFEGITDIGADEHVFSIIKPDTMPEMLIDGDISEFAETDSITFSSPAGGSSVKVQALWDSEALYLAYEVSDTQLNAYITTRDGNVKDDDAAGWVIDTLNNDGGSEDPNAPYMLRDDYQGLVNIKNIQYDSRGTLSGVPTSSWNGSWQSAVRFNGTVNDNSDIDTGYTVEVKIPWTDLEYLTEPSVNATVRIGFLLYDRDDSYCDVDSTGTYFDAEYFTGTVDPASSFSEKTTQEGYLNSSYLETLLPVASSMWSNSTIPSVIDGGVDNYPVNLGVVFTSSQDGYVHGVRFYKSALNTATHKGVLWSCATSTCASGTKLAEVTFTGETASGWQQAMFSIPQAITAGNYYIIAYHLAVPGTGHYSKTMNSFSSDITNSPITFPKSTVSRKNGRYIYNASTAFPAYSYADTNYWVDVVFLTSATLPSCSDISGFEYKKYELDFEAGDYKVWLRGYAVTGADTVIVGVDGSCIGTYQFNTINQWSWSNTALEGTNSTGSLSAGTHHIDIWTRQANVLIDGIYLTTGPETPTDGSHGIEIDPTDCGTTSHAIWPEGGGTAYQNASNWQEVKLTIPTSYYCDDDYDGYLDSYLDGRCFGTNCNPVECPTSAGYDCNDNNSVINPDTKWYPDRDGDYHGDQTYAFVQCNQPSGPPDYVLDKSDCDDNDAYIYPGGPEVRIVNQPTSYYWIHELQAAYNDAINGETIQSRLATYTGNLALGQSKSVIMEGGYDCAYSVITGKTTIMGDLITSDGSVIVEGFELQKPPQLNY